MKTIGTPLQRSVPEVRVGSLPQLLPSHTMQAILRKYSPGLMTAAIYTGILLFALFCTFAGR